MAFYTRFDTQEILPNTDYSFGDTGIIARSFPSTSNGKVMIEIRFINDDQRIELKNVHGDTFKALTVWNGFSVDEFCVIRMETLPLYVNAVFQLISQVWCYTNGNVIR